MRRSLKWFSVATTIGMLLVLIGGSLVTNTGSALGCGRSWPLCYDQVVPKVITPQMVIELAHRMISGIEGFMVLILSIWTWKEIGHIRETKLLSFLSFFFLMLQAFIGAAAVKWGQSGYVLALHFGISLISFASTLLLTLLIFEVDKKFAADQLKIDKRMGRHILFVTVFSYFVIYTGALVRHTNSGLACTSWPLCSRNLPFLIPQNLNQWVQMGHRLAAGIIFFWIGFILYLSIKHYQTEKVLVWGWILSFCLVFLQALAGALLIFTQLNLALSLLHSLFVSCLFGVLSYLLLLYSRSIRTKN